MVEIIGAGLPRTGTLSLKAALEELGYGPCYHMSELLRRPKLAERWLEVARGGEANWPTLLEGYRSTVDWPGSAFWQELIGAYPDAKVILTVRDPERWYASMKLLVHGGRSMRAITAPAVRRLVPPLGVLASLIETLVGRQYGVSPEHMRHGTMAKDDTIESYARHNAEVAAAVPEDRLLVFRVEDGWEPLCEFLGRPVPDTPFPHHNEAGRFHRDTWRRLAPSYARSAGLALGALAVIGVAAGAARAHRGRHRRP